MKNKEVRTITVKNMDNLSIHKYDEWKNNKALKDAVYQVQKIDYQTPDGRKDLSKATKFSGKKPLSGVDTYKVWANLMKVKPFDEITAVDYKNEFMKLYSKNYETLIAEYKHYLPQLTDEQIEFGANQVLFGNAITGMFVEEAIKDDLSKTSDVKNTSASKEDNDGIDFYLDGKPIQVKSNWWFISKQKQAFKIIERKYKNKEDLNFMVYYFDKKNHTIFYTYLTFNQVFKEINWKNDIMEVFQLNKYGYVDGMYGIYLKYKDTFNKMIGEQK